MSLDRPAIVPNHFLDCASTIPGRCRECPRAVPGTPRNRPWDAPGIYRTVPDQSTDGPKSCRDGTGPAGGNFGTVSVRPSARPWIVAGSTRGDPWIAPGQRRGDPGLCPDRPGTVPGTSQSSPSTVPGLPRDGSGPRTAFCAAIVAGELIAIDTSLRGALRVGEPRRTRSFVAFSKSCGIW